MHDRLSIFAFSFLFLSQASATPSWTPLEFRVGTSTHNLHIHEYVFLDSETDRLLSELIWHTRYIPVYTLETRWPTYSGLELNFQHELLLEETKGSLDDLDWDETGWLTSHSISSAELLHFSRTTIALRYPLSYPERVISHFDLSVGLKTQKTHWSGIGGLFYARENAQEDLYEQMPFVLPNQPIIDYTTQVFIPFLGSQITFSIPWLCIATSLQWSPAATFFDRDRHLLRELEFREVGSQNNHWYALNIELSTPPQNSHWRFWTRYQQEHLLPLRAHTTIYDTYDDQWLNFFYDAAGLEAYEHHWGIGVAYHF